MENRKVYLDKHSNLLQLEEHMYPLVDVKKPNVFRNLFRYDEIPKIAFNDRIVPHSMPDDIWITDTTFRDGQQSRAPYSTEQIVKLYEYFHRLGGPKGKLRQCEFFLYSKKDRDAVYQCMEKGYEFPEVTSWIRASKKDFELVKEIGMKETGILVSCSDYHIFYKLKMTRRECMEHYLSVVRECLETGISPRCHLEDITRSDIYGFVIPFCLELMKLMEEYQIPAGEELSKELETVTLHSLDIPYVTNVTAEKVEDIRKTKGLLKAQVSSPVRWMQSMEYLIREGVDTFVEIGPGKTLAGFLKKIDRNVRVCNIASWEDMEKVTGEFREER